MRPLGKAEAGGRFAPAAAASLRSLLGTAAKLGGFQVPIGAQLDAIAGLPRRVGSAAGAAARRSGGGHALRGGGGGGGGPAGLAGGLHACEPAQRRRRRAALHSAPAPGAAVCHPPPCQFRMPLLAWAVMRCHMLHVRSQPAAQSWLCVCLAEGLLLAALLLSSCASIVHVVAAYMQTLPAHVYIVLSL